MAAAALTALCAHGAIGASPAPATNGSDEVQPLELVAVDVSRFPRVVFDVALPAHELATEVRAGAFELPGATDLAVEALDPGDLTLAVVLDDGRRVPPEAVAVQQGSATELVRNLPRRVELIVLTTSGVQIGPSTDRVAAMRALAAARAPTAPDNATLGDAMIEAARRMKRVEDPRRQLIVLTGDDVDITAFESAAVTAALDRAGGAMRVVAIGAAAGSNLVRTAVRSGGAAIGVDPDPAAAVRAIDVLTSTFGDQYRVAATMAAAGPQVVRLTVEGRRYETVVPGLGPPSQPSSTTPTSSAPPTTAGPPAMPAPSEAAPGAAPTIEAATTVPTVAAVPAAGSTVPGPADDGRDGSTGASSPVAAAQAVVAFAGIAVIIAAGMRKRRSWSVRAGFGRYSPKK